METPQPPQIDPASAGEPSMSLTDRFTDMFFSPGAVFDDVKLAPPKAVNWLLPLILSMVVSVVSAIVIFSQPAIMQQLLQQVHQKQAKAFQKAISEGKMTEQQAADLQDKTEKAMPMLFRIAAPIGAFFFSAFKLFAVALVAWLVARFAFHSQISYMKAVEFTGLATVVSIVGALITTLLITSYGDMLATSGPALLVGHRDSLNKVHVTLARLDVFELWFVGLVAYGVARMSGVQWFKPALCLYAIWALLMIGGVWIS
jgi:hypothetical protein